MIFFFFKFLFCYRSESQRKSNKTSRIIILVHDSTKRGYVFQNNSKIRDFVILEDVFEHKSPLFRFDIQIYRVFPRVRGCIATLIVGYLFFYRDHLDFRFRRISKRVHPRGLRFEIRRCFFFEKRGVENNIELGIQIIDIVLGVALLFFQKKRKNGCAIRSCFFFFFSFSFFFFFFSFSLFCVQTTHLRFARTDAFFALQPRRSSHFFDIPYLSLFDEIMGGSIFSRPKRGFFHLFQLIDSFHPYLVYHLDGLPVTNQGFSERDWRI